MKQDLIVAFVALIIIAFISAEVFGIAYLVWVAICGK